MVSSLLLTLFLRNYLAVTYLLFFAVHQWVIFLVYFSKNFGLQHIVARDQA